MLPPLSRMTEGEGVETSDCLCSYSEARDGIRKQVHAERINSRLFHPGLTANSCTTSAGRAGSFIRRKLNQTGQNEVRVLSPLLGCNTSQAKGIPRSGWVVAGSHPRKNAYHCE